MADATQRAHWSIDKAHSEVTFAVRHMMVSTVRGSFGDFDATIDIDEEHPERSTVQATISVASISTAQPDRDAHLRSPDFFDAERFPQMTFTSRKVERTGEEGFRVTGDLTIRDVTREMALFGEFLGPVQDYAGDSVVGFSLSGEIDRDLFGLDLSLVLPTGGVVVGKTVKIAIEAEVKHAVEVVAAA